MGSTKEEAAPAEAEEAAEEEEEAADEGGDEEEEEEEEPEDIKPKLEEACASHCTALKAELDKCSERVNSRSKTEETCAEELFDFLHCIDHCTSKTLFSHLK